MIRGLEKASFTCKSPSGLKARWAEKMQAQLVYALNYADFKIKLINTSFAYNIDLEGLWETTESSRQFPDPLPYRNQNIQDRSRSQCPHKSKECSPN